MIVGLFFRIAKGDFMKKIAAGLAGAALAAGVGVAAAPAASAAPAPYWQPLGNISWIPPNGHCQGGIATTAETMPDPGMVHLTFTPVGTYGSAPGCDVTMSFGAQNGVPPFVHHDAVTVSGGPATFDVRTGQGLSMLFIEAITPFGSPTGGYVWMPPQL